MRCPTLTELPPPPLGKAGWPWTEESQQLPEQSPTGTPWAKISLVLPSYNQGRFLEESLRSVLLQGYPDLEIIIIDAGSTDETLDLIKKYERWIAYWESAPDRGQSHAINKGLERSTGEFFNWQNTDDILTPNSLAHTASVILQYPEASYVHGYRFIIDEDSQILYDVKAAPEHDLTFFPDIATAITSLKGGLQLGSLMRRELVIKAGKIDETLHYIMDRDLVLRLQLLGPPIYTHFPVISWRRHPEAKTVLWNAERAKERLLVARKIFQQTPLNPAIAPLKRATFATAHRFAWECYGKSGLKFRTFGHALLDILYLPEDAWKLRKRLVKNLRRHTSGRWLDILKITMTAGERLAAFLGSNQ